MLLNCVGVFVCEVPETVWNWYPLANPSAYLVNPTHGPAEYACEQPLPKTVVTAGVVTFENPEPLNTTEVPAGPLDGETLSVGVVMVNAAIAIPPAPSFASIACPPTASGVHVAGCAQVFRSVPPGTPTVIVTEMVPVGILPRCMWTSHNCFVRQLTIRH